MPTFPASNWRRKPPLGVRLRTRHRLVSRLRGLWLFNEMVGGVIYDLSRYKRHATLNPGSAWLSDACDLDGITGYLSLPSIIDCGTDFTLLQRLYHDDSGFDAVAGDGSGSYSTLATSYGWLRGSYGVNSIANWLGSPPPTGQWYDYATHSDGAHVSFYVDGKKATIETGITGNFKLNRFGHPGGSGRGYWDGRCSFAALFVPHITDAEIADLYTDPWDMFQPCRRSFSFSAGTPPVTPSGELIYPSGRVILADSTRPALIAAPNGRSLIMEVRERP